MPVCQAPSGRGTIRILIVEDERITAADLSASLTRLGYGVASVASGEEAIAQTREFRPDLVIMDVRLRGPMDGVEAGRRITEHWHIPIIYLSAFLDSDVRERAQGRAAVCLAKPFDAAVLHTTIQAILQTSNAGTKNLPGFQRERSMTA